MDPYNFFLGGLYQGVVSLLYAFADFGSRLLVASAPSATESSAVIDSTKVAPLEPAEKSSYA